MNRPSASLIVVTLWALSSASAPAQGIRILTLGGGSLGIKIRDISSGDLPDLQLDAESGVLITTVHPDTGAEAAGLREGDVILEFAGLPILSVRHLQRLVSETPVGRTVEVGVLRAGQRRSFAGRVEERDAGRFGGLEGLGEFMRALPDLERLIPEFQQGQEPPGYHLARDSA